LVQFAVVVLPVALLALASTRAQLDGKSPLLLVLGTTLQALLSAVLYRSLRKLGTSAFVLYIVALAMLWLGMRKANLDDWYVHFAQAMLLVGSMGLLAWQILFDSNAREIHYACTLAQRLASRRDWPEDAEGCVSLPEVKALREAIHHDASPAFALLRHERPQVRLAALAALEFRRDWRPGQAELILDVAKRSPEAPVRAAAVRALANVRNRLIVERVGEFLRDADAEVRYAAAEVLLWDTDKRWAWLRNSVRDALADPDHQADGPLLRDGHMLSAEAVKDLEAWITEKGTLSVRSVLTLMVHYDRVLNEAPDDRMIEELRRQVLEPRAPVVLRIELAQLLQGNQLLTRDMEEKLLDPLNPAPLRLIAADALLAANKHAGAVTALRDVARMPNREIALATADIVQRRLNVDLGLAIGQPLPAVNTRQAIEVTRRVMAWARSGDTSDDPSEPAPVFR
jgi:HEAT repeat protein